MRKQEEKKASDDAYNMLGKLFNILESLSGKKYEVDNVNEATHCCFCGEVKVNNPIRLSICGHTSCKECLEKSAERFSNGDTGEKIVCGIGCPIALDDIREYTSKSAKFAVLSHGVRKYLYAHPECADVFVCPTKSCNSLIKKNMPYKACKGCLIDVCGSCGTSDDRIHKAISIDTFSKPAIKSCL